MIKVTQNIIKVQNTLRGGVKLSSRILRYKQKSLADGNTMLSARDFCF